MRQGNGAGRDLTMLVSGLAIGVLGSKLVPPLLGALSGAGSVRTGGDPFALLIEDHRQLNSLLDKMLAAPTESTSRRSGLYLLLKRKLGKHALAEEDVVYPIVHNQTGESDRSKHLYDEHADMKILLYELENKLKNGEDWRSTVASLAGLIRRHIEEEEQTVFPKLREQLAAARLPAVAGQIWREEGLIV
jgi:hemerythrin superfamily protein